MKLEIPFELPWAKKAKAKVEVADVAALKQPKKPVITSGMWRFIGVAPVVALGLAIGATVFAGSQLNSLVYKKQTELSYVIAKTPLSSSDTQSLAAKLTHLNPSLSFKAEQSKITINTKSNAVYSEFVYALTTLPGVEKQVSWEMVSLCLNDCPNGMALEAVVSGSRQKVKMEGGDSKTAAEGSGLAPLAPLK